MLFADDTRDVGGRWVVPGAVRIFTSRGSRRIARYVVGVDIPSTGPWELTDPTAPPNTESTWEVRAVTAKVESTINPTATALSRVDGVWLVSEEHGRVVLDGETAAADLRYTDRRVTVELPFSKYPVDIIGALGVFGGAVGGIIDNEGPTTVAQKKAVIDAIAADPNTPLQIVYGTLTETVKLRNVSVTPEPEMLPDYDQFGHIVQFEVYGAEAD